VGVYAAPLLLPVLFVMARKTQRITLRILWAVLAAAIAAEGAWGLSYALLDEHSPWIWLLPTVGAGLAGTVTLSVDRWRSKPRVAPA
jgi:VIT1/CCC1 family predicted Fe2+/Mn2+ transporter